MDPPLEMGDLQRLIDIVERHGLDSLRITEGDVEVHIEADRRPTVEAVAEAEAAVPDEVSPYLPLRSPVTGVFYRSPGPNDSPFVEVGEVVEPNDRVCIIEAMKIFNDIPAGVHGRVARVVAANEQLVMAGEVLMEFEPLEASP